jgi:hypothetical protein
VPADKTRHVAPRNGVACLRSDYARHDLRMACARLT